MFPTKWPVFAGVLDRHAIDLLPEQMKESCASCFPIRVNRILSVSVARLEVRWCNLKFDAASVSCTSERDLGVVHVSREVVRAQLFDVVACSHLAELHEIVEELDELRRLVARRVVADTIEGCGTDCINSITFVSPFTVVSAVGTVNVPELPRVVSVPLGHVP